MDNTKTEDLKLMKVVRAALDKNQDVEIRKGKNGELKLLVGRRKCVVIK